MLGGLESDPPGDGRELQHSDVGLMLAEALDQQELPSSGALPVAMSFDRNDVFERLSALPPEVAVTAAKEIEKAPTPAPAPLMTAPTLPGPPTATPAGPPPPPARTGLASATALPSAKATLMMGAPTPSHAMSAVSAPAVSPPPSRATALAPPLHTPAPPPALGSTAVMAAPSRAPTPAPVRVATPSPALASTAVMNPLANAPTPAAAMPKAEPAAADCGGDQLFPRATPNAETTFVSAQSPPPATKAVDVAVTTPGKTVSVTRDESRDALTMKRPAAAKPIASLPVAASSGAAAPPTSSSTPATKKRAHARRCCSSGCCSSERSQAPACSWLAPSKEPSRGLPPPRLHGLW